MIERLKIYKNLVCVFDLRITLSPYHQQSFHFIPFESLLYIFMLRQLQLYSNFNYILRFHIIYLKHIWRHFFFPVFIVIVTNLSKRDNFTCFKCSLLYTSTTCRFISFLIFAYTHIQSMNFHCSMYKWNFPALLNAFSWCKHDIIISCISCIEFIQIWVYLNSQKVKQNFSLNLR